MRHANQRLTNLLKLGDSAVDWINFRRIFNRLEVRLFSLFYPLLGQYIIVLDGLIRSGVKFETYFLYVGLLLYSICGFVFMLCCPFFFKSYDSMRDFTTKFMETQENTFRLQYFLGSSPADLGENWEAVLTHVWRTNIKINPSLKFFIVLLLAAATVLLAISAVTSIGRVLYSAVA